MTRDQLAVLDADERRLATITTVDDAKAIRDKAEAIRRYAKSAKLGLKLQNRAARVKILAEQRAGTLLTEWPRAQGRHHRARSIRTMLVRIAIPLMTAHRWQRIAQVAPTEIRRLESQLTAQQLELTSALIYRTAPAHRDALARAGRRAVETRHGAHPDHPGVPGDTVDPHGRWQLWYGDFRERAAAIDARSVDVILTDPPYPTEAHPLWSALGTLAARVLRRGGVLLARAPHLSLPKILTRFTDAGLRYGWLYAEPLAGSNVRFLGRHIAVAWQPWVAYSAGPWPSSRLEWHPDLLAESPRTKRRYVWEQKWTVAAELIATFAGPGAFVLDPMAGTGTYGVAALRVGCRWLGIESDGAGLLGAVKRLHEIDGLHA